MKVEKLILPLLVSSLSDQSIPIFYHINYGEDREDKYEWQEEALKLILKSPKNGVISLMAKTGHGKTKVICDYAKKDKRTTIIYLKYWKETKNQFKKEMDKLKLPCIEKDGEFEYKKKDGKKIIIKKMILNHPKLKQEFSSINNSL